MMELSPQLQSKLVYVKAINSSPMVYVNVTRLYEGIATHTQLSTIQHPCSTLTALYIVTGCDYLSFFYRVTKQNFLNVFLENLEHICCNGRFIEIGDNTISILEDSWIKLVVSVYFYKHHKFYKSKSVACVYNGIKNSPTAYPFADMLKWLEYEKIDSLVQWHEFVRKVTFQLSKVDKDYESKLLPSWQSLVFHCKRADYVLKLIASASSIHSPHLLCEQFGWNIDANKCSITVNWGLAETIDMDIHKGCGCKTGCNTNRCYCFSHQQLCSNICTCSNCKNSENPKNTTIVVATSRGGRCMGA